jgi:nitrate reductase NapE
MAGRSFVSPVGTEGAMQADAAEPRKWREAVVFLFLSVMVWPVLAGGFVAAYGLAWWVYFIFAGPPGPH